MMLRIAEDYERLAKRAAKHFRLVGERTVAGSVLVELKLPSRR